MTMFVDYSVAEKGGGGGGGMSEEARTGKRELKTCLSSESGFIRFRDCY